MPFPYALQHYPSFCPAGGWSPRQDQWHLRQGVTPRHDRVAPPPHTHTQRAVRLLWLYIPVYLCSIKKRVCYSSVIITLIVIATVCLVSVPGQPPSSVKVLVISPYILQVSWEVGIYMYFTGIIYNY